MQNSQVGKGPLVEDQNSQGKVGHGPVPEVESAIRNIWDDDGMLDPERLDTVEAQLAQDEAWRVLGEVYAVAAERAADPEMGRRMLLSAGLLYLEQLGEPRRGALFLHRVLASEPDQPDALQGLVSAYLAEGRHEEAADLCERLIELLPETERAQALVDLADIVHTQLGQTDRALYALRCAYEWDSSRWDVLDSARALFQAEGRYADAQQVLDDEARGLLGEALDQSPAAITTAVQALVEQAEGAEPGSEPAEALLAVRRLAEAYGSLAEVLLTSATQHDLADVCLQTARALGDEAALSKLDDLASLRTDWQARANALRDAGFETSQKKKAAELYLQAAELFARYGQDALRADEYLDRCLILSPGFVPALRYLEALHKEQGREGDLIKRLNGMAAQIKDPSTKADILLRVAQLEEAVLPTETAPEPEEVERVINAYRRLLALQPGHREAVARLGDILGADGRAGDLAQVYEAHLAALSDPYTRVQVHLDLGRIYAEQLGDSARSRNHFEAVLSLRGSHFLAASALRALYKDANEAPLLLSVQKVLLDHCPDLFSRLDLLAEMASVAQEVSKDEAFAICKLTFELDPSAEGAQGKLEALAAELNRDRALANALAAAAAHRRGPHAEHLWMAAARLFDSKLPRPMDAIRGFKEALRENPSNTEATAALERLLREQDDPEALVEMLRAQLGMSKDPEQGLILRAKIGDVLAQRLDDLDGAIEMFEAVQVEAPDNGSALRSLDGLYARTERYEEQAKVLDRLAEGAEGEQERAEFACRRASLLDAHLDDSEGGAAVYLEVLDYLPEHPALVPALAALLAKGVCAEQLAAVLEPIYARQGDNEAQLGALRVLIEAATSTARATLAKKAAQIAKYHLDDPQAALQILIAALSHAPEDDALIGDTVELSRTQAAVATVAQALTDILHEGLDDGAVRSRVATALAELLERDLEDPSGAVDRYQEALAADGSNAPAIAALERLLGAQARYAELAELLEQRLADTDDPAAQVQLGLSLAGLKDEHLDDPKGAISALEDVLRVAPEDSTVLARLAGLLEAQGDFAKLVAVLDRIRDSSGDLEVQAQSEVRVGEVLRQHLGDQPQAIARFERALSLSAGHAGAVRGLEPLLDNDGHRTQVGLLLAPCYELAERWPDLVLALESQLAGQTDKADRGELLAQIAQVEADRLDDAEAAFETLARAFREGLLAQAQAERMADLAQQSGKAKVLARLYEEALRGGDADLEMLRALSRLYDGAAADPAKAKDMWNRVLGEVPADEEALEALERLTAAGDNPAALGAVLEQRAEAASTEPERVAFLKRAAGIYEEAAEDMGAAVRVMEQARTLEPHDRAVLSELARYYVELGDAPNLDSVLSSQIDCTEEPLSLANLLVKRGEAKRVGGDAGGAIADYSAAVAQMPEHSEARAGLEGMLQTEAAPLAAVALEPVYRAAGDWARLVDTYEILVSASVEPSERVERLVAIRSIYEERLGQTDRAFGAAARAWKEMPANEELLDGLERLGRLSGAVDELIGLIEDQAEALPYVSEERAVLRLRVARYAETLLQDRQRTVEAYQRALEERPDSMAALEALQQSHANAGEHRELVEVLRKMAGLLEDPTERAARLATAGRILEEQLGDRVPAAHLFEQVIMIDPSNAEALDRLDALYSHARASEDLARILKQRVQHCEGAAQASLRLRLGQLEMSALQNPRGALEVYTAILAGPAEVAEGSYDGALYALDDLMETLRDSNPELAAEAARTLQPHWAQKGQTSKIVGAKEVEVLAAEDPDARKAILLDIAGLYETQLEQPELAFLALTRAYGEHPNDVELADELERVAGPADTYEELAELFAQALPSVDDQELALRLARRTANLYDTHLGRADLAVPHYNWVLKLVPGDGASLAALEQIHTKHNDAGHLADVLRGMLAVQEDDDAKKALHGRIAQLLEADIGDTDGAFAAYRAMLEIDPTDRSVLRRLAALCENSDRLDDLALVLGQDIELAEDDDDRAQGLLRLGTLRKDRLGVPVGAVDAFSQVLRLRPGDPGAIAGLAAVLRAGAEGRPEAALELSPIYRDSGAVAEYVDCLQIRVDASDDPVERRELLVEIAESYESRLGRAEHAFTYAQRALHEDPSDGGVRARLERLAGENDQLEELAAFYLDEVENIDDHDLGLGLRRRVAEIYDDELKDVPRAIAEYGRVLDVAPGDRESLLALERLFRQTGSFDELADIYRRRIAQSDDNEARAELLRQFSKLQAQELSDAPGAIASLRRLLDIEPDDLDALSRLAALCKQQGRSSELADVLERLIETAGDAQGVRLDAQLELGRLKLDTVGDVAGAQVHFREVLHVDPAHEATREFLQDRFEDAIAEDEGARAEAFGALLADALRSTEDWQALISVLRMRAEVSHQAAERVPLDREVAEIYELRLEQPELAFTTLARVFGEAPGIEEVREGLDRLAEELSMWEELVDVLQAGLPNAHDSELAQAIHRRIAQVLDGKLGDKERATEGWQVVLSSEPMDIEGLTALDRLCEALGRWAGVADVLEKRIQLSQEGEERHALCMRLGAVWDERLSETEEGIEWYRRARAEQPRERETLSALSRLLNPEADGQELFAVLEALVEQEPDARTQLRLKLRMADISQGVLQKPNEAIDLYKSVLGMEATNTRALEGLETLYEAEGHWGDLAEMLERQLERARDEKEMTRLQRRLGLIKGTRLGSVDEAISSWSEILKRNPNDVEALGALRQIYAKSERWEDLVATLRKLIPLQLDANGVKAIRFELAEVFFTHLKQNEEAIESAKRVLDVEPHTVSELMALEEILVKCGAYGEAVRVMNFRAEQAETRGEQIDILFDIANVYEGKVGRLVGAAQAYEQVLELEPTSAKAFDALGAIYEKNGDYRRLVELHNRRLDVTEEAKGRRNLLYAIIDVQERWLGHPELAFSAACRAFAEDGADEHAQGLAERLAEETGNWEILADVYLDQVDQVGVNRAVQLHRRLGEIYLEQLDEADEAEKQFELVLAMRLEDDDAREQLISLFSAQDRWSELIAQLTDKVELSTEVEDKKLIFRRIAEIEETKLEDVEAAISSTKRVLDLDPEDPRAMLDLSRIFRTHEKWHPLLNMLKRRLEQTEADDERVNLRMELAGVWETGIEDVDQAIEHYKDVLDLNEIHLPALKALERLYIQCERWIELVDIYERQVELTDASDAAIDILTRVATIWEEQFRDLEGAAKSLIRLLEVDPDHLPTIKGLERIWREAEDWEHLVEAKERHVELETDPTEVVALYMEIGDIQLRHLGRVDEAEQAFGSALSQDPGSQAATHALGQLHERHGNWFNALEMLSREASLLGAKAEAVQVHHRMAKINEDMLMDREAAVVAYGRALDIEPGFAPSIRALRKMNEQDERFEEVVSLLCQEALYSDEAEEQAELYTRAADLALEQFDDEDQAIRAYDKALEADPHHVPALRIQGDLLFAREDWNRSESLLSTLVELLDRSADTEELCRQYYRLAYIAEKLGEDHQALKRYLASYELDSTYLPTLEGLGAALLRAERWEDAQRIFQTILIQHRTSLTDAEVVDLHWQIGELAERLDLLPKAQKSFAKALDLDAQHGPTLMASAHLAERLEDWEDAYDHREKLIGLLQGDERFTALVEQASLCEAKIKEPYRAIDAYMEARRERPDNADVLKALARLFDETGQVPQAIEVLNDLGQVLVEPKARRDLFTQLAEIHATQEENYQGAVAALNNALDLDPMHIAAFSRIEQLLYDARDWRALEENYHRMIKRMPKAQTKARLVLWRSVGDLYARVLKNEEGARVAYEVVLNKLDPEAWDVALALAELYAKTKETAPKAIALYHRVISNVEDPATPARRLFELYHALGHIDRAFCALGALVLMRAASPDEVKAYQLLLKKAPQWPARNLSDSLWRTHVLHTGCRNGLSEILSVLYRGGPQMFDEPLKNLKLGRREKVDLAAKGRNARVRLRYFDVWQRLHAALHVGDMEHFHRPGISQAPRMHPGTHPVLFAGEQHEVFKTMPPRLIAWTLARQMASARPELAPLRAMVAPDEVGAAIEAAIRLFLPEGSGVDLNLDPQRVQAWQQAIPKYLSDRALKALRDPVSAVIQKKDMKYLRRFLEGCEHSASRAALLMSGDVVTAERGLGDSDLLVDVSFRQRVRELMLFTLSEEHFQLREKLGLAIPS